MQERLSGRPLLESARHLRRVRITFRSRSLLPRRIVEAPTDRTNLVLDLAQLITTGRRDLFSGALHTLELLKSCFNPGLTRK